MTSRDSLPELKAGGAPDSVLPPAPGAGPASIAPIAAAARATSGGGPTCPPAPDDSTLTTGDLLLTWTGAFPPAPAPAPVSEIVILISITHLPQDKIAYLPSNVIGAAVRFVTVIQ
jgi:hypothetical protein